VLLEHIYILYIIYITVYVTEIIFQMEKSTCYVIIKEIQQQLYSYLTNI